MVPAGAFPVQSQVIPDPSLVGFAAHILDETPDSLRLVWIVPLEPEIGF